MEGLMNAVHYVTSDLRTPGQIRVEGIGANAAAYTKGSTTVRLRSLNDEAFSMQFEVYILPTITTMTPVCKVDSSAWDHLSGLQLADPTFGTPAKIDLLIGADIWPALIADGIAAGPHDEPKCIGDQKLDKLDAGPVDELSVDPCERIFIDTVRRTASGRYSVQIPFLPNAPVLGDSYQAARRQFFHLERKLAGDPELRNKYIMFMQEYIALGHMSPVKDDCIDPTQCYYIPHHAVTGKFRVVFNASCKTTSGVSLNDTQFSGPQLQDNLIDILHRFRRYRVAITADVKKMFRQVEINPLHRKWQRILWRESPVEPLRSFEFATVTYGMTSSPYNAIRSFRQCAVDNYNIVEDENRASTARKSILDGFYVDDYLESFDSLV
ncbi:uncharacterized protein LOC128920314 [Zeugodacus cucurbitae]|uniref:uncharacterized protein LOC128920314 n=1 Tax=Zeugodacus cucurbitae TaxID=28588 RepID=UPI0023D8F50B|nr:uncharacterized protein LOC128920314 [Zeugodacus cucurbitae]